MENLVTTVTGLKVKQDSLPNPPTTITETIQPSQLIDIYRDYDYIRILEFSGNAGDLEITFGTSGTPATGFTAGEGFELPYVMNRIQLRNVSGSAVSVTLGLAIGIIHDDRLNFTGTIQTNQVVANSATNVVTSVSDSVWSDETADTTIQEIILDTSKCTAEIGILYGESTAGKTIADCGVYLQPNTINVITFQGERHYISRSGTQELHVLVTRRT